MTIAAREATPEPHPGRFSDPCRRRPRRGRPEPGLFHGCRRAEMLWRVPGSGHTGGGSRRRRAPMSAEWSGSSTARSARNAGRLIRDSVIVLGDWFVPVSLAGEAGARTSSCRCRPDTMTLATTLITAGCAALVSSVVLGAAAQADPGPAPRRARPRRLRSIRRNHRPQLPCWRIRPRAPRRSRRRPPRFRRVSTPWVPKARWRSSWATRRSDCGAPPCSRCPHSSARRRSPPS